MRRIRAYIGLGANLGDPTRAVAGGVRALAALADTRLHAVSRLYETAPVGVVDQPRFRNAVVALDVPAGPDPASGAVALLVALKQLERAFGRQERERWGPRELDLDLLVFGRSRLSIDRPPEGMSLDPGKADRLLVVPHREAARAAVRPRPARRPRPEAGAARLDRDRRDRRRAPARRRRPRRGPADRDVGRRPRRVGADRGPGLRLTQAPRKRVGSAVSTAPPRPSGSTRQAPAAGSEVTTSTSARSRKTSAAPSSAA